jgi:hypothetical protein
MRFLILTLLLAGCYRMPTDDDFCVIPTTNNPSVTREGSHQQAASPGGLGGMRM